MTTPERLRRRQRREEVGLILLGIVVGLLSIYFHHQDVDSRKCVTDNFARFSNVLTMRGALADRDAAANRDESAATRQLIIDAFASKDRQAAFAAFRKAQRRWGAVDKERRQIARARASHPIPDFPKGSCGS